MFNLFISADEEAWERPSFVLDAERFLEYTDDQLKKRFRVLDEDVKKTLIKLPTLFAYESPISKPARVGSLNSIEKQGRQIRITYSFSPSLEPVDPERVRAVAWDAFEMTRTHWALKDGEILDVLAPLQSASAAEPTGHPAAETTYSLSRLTLLSACDRFPALGHSGFDRFLLEVGIDGIKAGRDRGGLAARATALAEFVVRKPTARTAEGEPLGLRVVRQAVELDPAVNEKARDAFRTALGRDGYEIRDGQLARQTASMKPAQSNPTLTVTWDETPGFPSSEPRVSLGNSTGPALATNDPPVTSMRSTRSTSSKKIFLVHGRDDGAKHEVARFLEKLGLEVVILHERPNGGRTLISKFREESVDVGFAVVMMTADDIGGLKPKEGSASTELAPRARQNVVFELGFFVGKLGPERVCALVVGTVEKPSDFEGVVYVPFGQGTTWRTDLARELRAAGIPFDPAKVL